MNDERKSSAQPKSRAVRARALAALADPTRLGAMDLLAVEDLSPDVLAARLSVPGNLLAHHLNVLQSAGLVRRVPSQSDRRRTYVQAVDGALAGLLPQPGMLSAPRIVFVCTHNSARSVLAEALWHEASEVPAASAGTHPAPSVNPRTVAAARRHRLDLSDRGPRAIGEVLRRGDVVVSVCDAVNEELGEMDNPRIHWSVPDPAAVGTVAAFDTAVEELRERVRLLAPRVRRARRTVGGLGRLSGESITTA